jgi:small subunit ribosomal protein S20
MAITHSAKKAWRQNLKCKKRNSAQKNQTKKLLKEFKSLASQNKEKEAKEVLSKVYKSLDKAVKTGIIKKNAASRKKSRMAKLAKSQK